MSLGGERSENYVLNGERNHVRYPLSRQRYLPSLPAPHDFLPALPPISPRSLPSVDIRLCVLMSRALFFSLARPCAPSRRARALTWTRSSEPYPCSRRSTALRHHRRRVLDGEEPRRARRLRLRDARDGDPLRFDRRRLHYRGVQEPDPERRLVPRLRLAHRARPRSCPCPAHRLPQEEAPGNAALDDRRGGRRSAGRSRRRRYRFYEATGQRSR